MQTPRLYSVYSKSSVTVNLKQSKTKKTPQGCPLCSLLVCTFFASSRFPDMEISSLGIIVAWGWRRCLGPTNPSELEPSFFCIPDGWRFIPTRAYLGNGRSPLCEASSFVVLTSSRVFPCIVLKYASFITFVCNFEFHPLSMLFSSP